MKRRKHYHLLHRVLWITSIVAVFPLVFGFLLIQHSAKTRLSDTTGANFVWFADNASSALDTALLREVEFLSLVARLSQSGAAASDRAQLLEQVEIASPAYRGLALIDLEGVPVATTFETDSSGSSGYGSEESFRRALSRARARAEVADSWAEANPDDGTLTLYRPVRDAESGQLVGLVRASLDVERLFAAVSGFRFGETGHACLFERASGRVLGGNPALCTSEERYGRFEDYERASRQERRYFLAGVQGPWSFERADAFLVGYSRPELVRSFPEADWVVTVEQSLAEAHGPLLSLTPDLILQFLAMAGLVVLLAFYLSYRLERPVTDVAVDLHQKPA
jgi:hypothetical protein